MKTPTPSRVPYADKKYGYLSINVIVRDCQGNKSELIEFPLTFKYKKPPTLPSEWQDVGNRSLGAIKVNLEDLLTPRRSSYR